MNNNMNLNQLVKDYLSALEATNGLTSVYNMTATEVIALAIKDVLIPLEKDIVFPGKCEVSFDVEINFRLDKSIYQMAIDSLCQLVRTEVYSWRSDVINRYYVSLTEQNRREREEREARYAKEREERDARYERQKKERQESYEKARNERQQYTGYSHRSGQATFKDYMILGCSSSDSFDVIKAAWRKLAMKNHPDTGGDLETMKMINAAYSNIEADFRSGVLR